MKRYHFLISWNSSRNLKSSAVGKDTEQQLIELIAEAYNRGNHPDHYMMPSVRILAKDLGVQRHLVAGAYRYWITREEILYSRGRQGTFMYSRQEKNPAIKVAASAQFSFQEKPVRRSGAGEHQGLNILTLGSTYPTGPSTGFNSNQNKMPGNFPSAMAFRRACFAKDMLGILRNRKLVNHERQFCAIPNGRAVHKVLKMITEPEDLMVMTSIDDFELVETAAQLGLNLAFTGTDEQGMSAEKLEDICLSGKVKVVFLRPAPDFPIPVSMTRLRWRKMVELAEKYGFCILVLDEDYEFLHKKNAPLPISLESGKVIYIAPYSKVTPVSHRVCMVAGPEDFIVALKERAKMVINTWNQSAEKAALLALSSSKLRIQVKKGNQCCVSAAYKWNMMVVNYLSGLATLTFADSGTFGFLKFKTPISGSLVANFMENRLFLEEENFAFEPDEPIDGFRFSLFIRDWTAIEFFMKMIRAMLDGR
ncbi:hypothetical protein [Pedobacter gandavensis]|uniref:hypothetical protein n=1 Tax=Pedobacter gandavensis TaxID=2679963 RepID=UPI002930FF4D|nr:hypothetical protein [Pedobacter gandavensis]